jgi:hypothetical protein
VRSRCQAALEKQQRKAGKLLPKGKKVKPFDVEVRAEN